MKSLVYHGPGNVTWGNLPIPEPGPGQTAPLNRRDRDLSSLGPAPDEWRTYVSKSGVAVSFTLRANPGMKRSDAWMPLEPGVDGPPVGTHVAAWRDPGRYRPGCYAEYNVFDTPNLLPIPEELPYPQMAPLELAMCVQVSIDQLARIRPSQVDRFGVTGSEALGLMAVQMAKAYGPREVIAVNPVEERRRLTAGIGRRRCDCTAIVFRAVR